MVGLAGRGLVWRVRSLLADSAFDQRDHAIEERFARIRTDLNAQRVADHLGATRSRWSECRYLAP